MERTILSHLIFNDKYTRKVLPFLDQQYFHDLTDKLVYNLINNYIDKYNQIPTKEILYIELGNDSTINGDQYNDAKQLIHQLQCEPTTEIEWLVDKTEQFCQDKAIYNAIRQSIQIIDGKTQLTKNAIPKILQDALQVSFDSSIGHDFIDDYDRRYDVYHEKQQKIDFDLDYFNKITQGGFPTKSLNLLLSTTGVGKTMTMCHMASHNLMCGKNVLYITLEMAEERIAQRIDCNLLDCTLDQLKHLSKMEYQAKIDKVKRTTKGKLIIKEYPTASAGAATFRHLLGELRIKKTFMPDIIYLDYLNLCLSSRIKQAANANSYTYIKAISEEIRGLAVEANLPIVSATQLNRGAQGASDVGIENTSDSLGIAMTADFMVALISTEELEQLNQIMVKQLKNRYNDPSINRRFVIGVDRSKMRLYDCEQSAQEDLIEGPVFDQSQFGNEDSERQKKATKFDKAKFRGFR